ncbi:MAG: Asp-tRNA(Asn)/Glu-tRNA(Gln) amidotransferase subunit GatC [Candidatus Omnitrophica bacterium]|nr:Asp-tRNA(Asn)/Glu-tRNA(Gln) amidotransferase subunit GatC [Candidatus Omnitrophota bacterium]
MAIDKKTVENVAHLARIELNPKELDKLSHQLQDILGFIDKLSRLDISKTPPTSHILLLSNILREDTPKPSLPVDKALANAPSREADFFSVPKVIE